MNERLEQIILNLTETCNRSHDDPAKEHAIDMIEAVLQWLNTPRKQDEPKKASIRDLFDDNPFGAKTISKRKNETISLSEDSVLADVLDLTASVFRLDSSIPQEELSRIVRHGTLLAKRLKEPAERRVTSLQTAVQELRGLTETIERMEAETIMLRRTEEERKNQIKEREIDLNSLKSKIELQYERIKAVERETELLNEKIHTLDSEEKELERKKQEIELKAEEIRTFKSRLDQMKNEQTQQFAEHRRKIEEESEIKSKIQQTKMKLQRTKEAVEKLKQHPLLDSNTTQHILEIWQSFLVDKLDREISDKEK